MHTDENLPMLVEQPRRIGQRSSAGVLRRVPRRFITAAETATLLEVTENVLRWWRARGSGPQPVPRPEGRLYAAEEIERLAAMPRARRMLAISRGRD